ncbi:unnamed protein product [Plutella xylostella]|uniref:(diamondback moth) hypothetical protein n=1 Tax=Plutella xylostella TaxID=51655 RepID=A0A8S4DIQ7_PLUXY|nr:unnamed protein product [Plutella xylostella]
MSFEDSNVEVPTPTAAATTTSTCITSPSNQPFTMDMLASLLDYKLLGIKSAITDFSSALAQIRSDIKSEISILSNRLDAVEHENAELRAKVDSLSHQPVASEDAIELREQVQQLQLELNERDQASLQNDVELTHIPESVGESVGHVVLAVARKLGVALEERDVVSAGRVGAPRRVEAGQPPRPRPIVVRFTRRALRDEIINSARVRRGADTSDLGSLGSKAKHEEFVVAVTNESPDILAINETWLRQGEEQRAPAVPGYRLRHVPRARATRPGERDRGGGVASLVKIDQDSLNADIHLINWDSICEMESVDEMVYVFTEYITNLFDRHAPEKTITLRERLPPWLTENVRHGASTLEIQPVNENDIAKIILSIKSNAQGADRLTMDMIILTLPSTLKVITAIAATQYVSASRWRCVAGAWLRELGFVACYGSVVLRLWVLLAEFRTRKAHRWTPRDTELCNYRSVCSVHVAANRLFPIKGQRRRWRLSAWVKAPIGASPTVRVLRIVAAMLVGAVCYLAAFTATAACDEGGEDGGAGCAAVAWHHVTAAAEILLLAAGLRIAYTARNANVPFQERNWLCAALCFEAACGVIWRVSAALGLAPEGSPLAASARAHLSAGAALACVLAPRLWHGCRARSLAQEVSRRGPAEGFAVEGEEEPSSEEVRAELKRLYVQLEILRNKTLRLDNPHISKRRGGRKPPHRRFSLQKKGSRDKVRRCIYYRMPRPACPVESMCPPPPPPVRGPPAPLAPPLTALQARRGGKGKGGGSASAVEASEAGDATRTPEDSVCSAEGPSHYTDGDAA